ncbi:MAG TPA: cupin domain-containing protein [Methylomirabilota bacterium]|jgi:quercetin dioxygenase-like cupin family protein|nr:cupin domain-containing protein [Methylomirabilota bacterium]
MRYRIIGVFGALALFAAGAGTGWHSRAAWSQPAGRRMSTDVLFRQTTDEIPRPVALRVHLNRWDPGSETGRHDHPGPVLHYVLEGELENIRDNGTDVMRAGEVKWEQPRVPHNVRNVQKRPARVLTIHFDPAT